MATPLEEATDEPWPEAPSYEQGEAPALEAVVAATEANTGGVEAIAPVASLASDSVERVKRIFPGRVVRFTPASIDAEASDQVALEAPVDADFDPELGGSA